MEKPTVAGLRSRSRSKTPFLRSSCDREQCAEAGDHIHHKSGRKTPVKRSTPIKQHQQSKSDKSAETIEEDPENEVTPAYRNQQTSRTTEKLIKTSDYSSEESLDRLKGHRKEIVQNEINSHYERVSTSAKQYSNLEDLPFSPIHSSSNVTQDRSSRFGSPTYSACSTDSSFAEQALADATLLLEREGSSDHLPYRLYKMAGEYWNKYPKTDYTYSPLSRDRVELAPGQVAVPNMSRRSLSQFRIQGPTSTDVVDEPVVTAKSAWRATTTVRKRYTGIDSSDDESAYVHNAPPAANQQWSITQLLFSFVATITTAISKAYRRIVGPSHRYPYTDRRPAKANIVSRAASVLVAPFYWLFTIMKTVITTTVTTVTEMITPNHVGESEKYIARSYKYKEEEKRRLWPWVLLVLLPIFGYGLNYTYQNYEHLSMPNFTDLHLDLSEFYHLEFPAINLPSIPNISLSDLNPFPRINLTLPEINITLPDVTENIPRVTKAYWEYKEIVQNRMTDASDYLTVVAGSCYEEVKRFWSGMLG